jgi:hypothetical protein
MGKQLFLLGGALLVAGFAVTGAFAQDDALSADTPSADTPSADTPSAAQAPAVQATEPNSAREFDRLLAPIALYPDQLLAQILMAATYPLDVVRAERWLQDHGNAALRGDALTAALDPLPWDPSVKSLVPFPRILAMMDGNIDWTEQLGQTFLANQAAVMDSVQRLRKLAVGAGTLQSGPQEVVATQGDAVTIAPAMPDYVSVPSYDPSTAYGDWPYPGYPPDYFPDYFTGIGYNGFGYGWWGVPVIWPLWGWGHCNWGYHRIFIDSDRWAGLSGGHRPPGNGVWQHEPGHRSPMPSQGIGPPHGWFGVAHMPNVVRGYPPVSGGELHKAVTPGRQLGRPAIPPTFGSLGHGPEAQSQPQRGFSNHMSAPVQHAMPSRVSAPVYQSGGSMHAASGSRRRAELEPWIDGVRAR